MPLPLPRMAKPADASDAASNPNLCRLKHSGLAQHMRDGLLAAVAAAVHGERAEEERSADRRERVAQLVRAALGRRSSAGWQVVVGSKYSYKVRTHVDAGHQQFAICHLPVPDVPIKERQQLLFAYRCGPAAPCALGADAAAEGAAAGGAGGPAEVAASAAASAPADGADAASDDRACRTATDMAAAVAAATKRACLDELQRLRGSGSEPVEDDALATNVQASMGRLFPAIDGVSWHVIAGSQRGSSWSSATGSEPGTHFTIHVFKPLGPAKIELFRCTETAQDSAIDTMSLLTRVSYFVAVLAALYAGYWGAGDDAESQGAAVSKSANGWIVVAIALLGGQFAKTLMKLNKRLRN